MINPKHILWLVLVVLSHMISWAQSNNVLFNRLSTFDKLSSYSVMSLYQDERGFIWIGTRNGLDLFDGNNIKVFKTSENEKNTLQSNLIYKIVGNQKGLLYIKNNGGIDCLDIKTEQIQPIVKLATGSMFLTEKEELYYTIGNRLFRYNNQKHDLLYELPNYDDIHTLIVSSDSIFMGTQKNGLYIWNKKNKNTKRLLQGLFIENIYKDSRGGYWIGTRQNGYYTYNNGQVQSGPRLGKDNYIRCFCEDKYHNMWIGTMNGLYKMHADSQDYDLYQSNQNESSISHNSVWALLRDHQDNIWVGTYFGGVDFFNSDMQFIQHYNDNVSESRLSNSVIGRMQEDHNHNLWICTDGGGLNCLNRTTEKITFFTTANGLQHNNVRAVLFCPEENQLYIGMHMGGLDCMDLKTKKIDHCLKEKDQSLVVNDIIRWNSNLLLATAEGIICYDRKTKVYHPLYKQGSSEKLPGGASFMFLDSSERLWLTGNDWGCFSYNLHTGESKSYTLSNEKHTPLKNVNYVYEDSRHRIWLCTGESGLLQLDEKSSTSRKIPFLKDESISSCTFSMCEINPDEYIVETNDGFYIFNEKKQQFVSYTHRKGFPLTSLFQPSMLKTSDGYIYLGGINGLIAFNPKDLQKDFKGYGVYPSRLFVNGQEVTPHDNLGILTHVISYTQNIRLNSEQSNFSVEYGLTDYVPTHRKDLEYRLDGYSRHWLPVTNGYIVGFNNLSPGNYVLRVRIKGATEESQLHIKILPPFYKTTWAYLIYLLIAIVIIIFLLRTQHRHIRLQEQIKFEQARIDYIENINQAKLRFFTNISHEFRTPLTVVIGHAQILLQQQDLSPEIAYKLHGLNKACGQLKDLINELLDFRKQEQDHIQLHVSEFDLVQYLADRLTIFSDYAQEKGIQFNLQLPQEPLFIWLDPKQFLKVINNLISNALKHTPKGKSITVSLESLGKTAVIKVIDTGKGIKASEVNNIFRRFYQTDISSVGTGIGLALTKGIVEEHHGTIEVESKEGIGSTFKVTIPIGKEQYTAEELKPIDQTQPLMQQENNRDYIYTLQPDKPQEQKHNKNLPTIVIVEDNEQLRDMLTQLLYTNYNVYSAEDGENGWNLIQQTMPDLILTDVVMPGRNGIELCKLVKETFDTCHIPVIMLTARTSLEHNMEGLSTGADDYITKPFNTELLQIRCNNIIHNRKLLQKKFATQPEMEISALTSNDKDKEFIEKIVNFIHKNLDNNRLNVEDIAFELCMSRTKFFTKLKNITGQTPHEFVIAIRLKEAAKLLRSQPDTSISDIANKVGFSSSRYFTKYFKDAMGVVPMEYRKRE